MAQSRIVDIHGNPLAFEPEPQTENDSKLGMLRKHYSEHPTVGLTPAKAAMALREAEAKKARQLKKKQAYKPDSEASFSWSANTPTRGRR